MAKRKDEHSEQEETQPYVLGQDVSVGGQDCKKGGTVHLTSEQAESMKAAGVVFEGDEPKSPEDLQAAHDEGVEAMKKRQEEEDEDEDEDEPVEGEA